MKLFNHETQQYEDVSSMDAAPLLAAGTHTPQQGAKLKMLDPKTSTEVEVEANVANDYARMGFLALDPQAPTSTALEDAQGFGYGLVQGLTLGTGGAIGTKLGLIEPETVQHLEDITPESIIAGELLSFAAPGLGEVSLGAKAGRVIGAAQRAPRLAGDLLVKAVEKGVGELGERGVKGAIKKAIPSAIEGGAWALGQQLTDDVVHDRDFSAEQWAMQGLLGAGIGGTLGAIVEFGAPKAFNKLKDLSRSPFKDIDELTNSQRKLRSGVDALRQPFTSEGAEFRKNILDRTYDDRKRDVVKNLKEHIDVSNKALGDVKSIIAEDTLENKQLIESLGGKIDFVQGATGKSQMVTIIPAKRGDVTVQELLYDIAGDVVIDNKVNPIVQDAIFEAGVIASSNNSDAVVQLAKKLGIEEGFDLLQFKGKFSAVLDGVLKQKVPRLDAQKRRDLARALASDSTDRLMVKLGAVTPDGIPIDTDQLAHDLMWATERFNAASSLERQLKQIVGEDVFKASKSSTVPVAGSDRELNKKLNDIIDAELEKEASGAGSLFADIDNHTDNVSKMLDDINKERSAGYRAMNGDVSSDSWQFNRAPVTGETITVPGMKSIKPLDVQPTLDELNKLSRTWPGAEAADAMRVRQTLDAAGENIAQGSLAGTAIGGVVGGALGHPIGGAVIGGALGGGFVPSLTGAGATRTVLQALRDPLFPARALYTLERMGIKRDAAILKAVDDVLQGKKLDKAKSATLMLLTKPSSNETAEEIRTRLLSDIEKIRNNPELLESDIDPIIRRAAPKAVSVRLATTLTAVEELMKHIPKKDDGAILSATKDSMNQTKLRDFSKRIALMSAPELLLEHPLASRDDVAMVERVFPRDVERMRQSISIAIQQEGDSLVDETKRRNAQRLAFLFGLPGLPNARPFSAVQQQEQVSAGNIKGQISTKSLMPSEALQLPASDNPLAGSIPESTPSQLLQQRAEGRNL